MDPILELKQAVIARLKGTPAIAAITGNRIYDVSPENGGQDPQTPYINFGQWDASDDNYECIDSVEISAQVNVWSYGPNLAASTAEANNIAHMVREALKNLADNVELPVNALATFEHRITRSVVASDGKTKQAAITFTAVVESPE